MRTNNPEVNGDRGTFVHIGRHSGISVDVCCETEPNNSVVINGKYLRLVNVSLSLTPSYKILMYIYVEADSE